MYHGLSDDARMLRFFTSAIDLEAQACRDANVDYARTYGVVAATGPDEQLIGQSGPARDYRLETSAERTSDE